MIGLDGVSAIAAVRGVPEIGFLLLMHKLAPGQISFIGALDGGMLGAGTALDHAIHSRVLGAKNFNFFGSMKLNKTGGVSLLTALKSKATKEFGKNNSTQI
jgi:hypothetical protein